MILSPFVDEQNRTRYYVLHFEDWNQFERIVTYVEHSLNGVVTERIDGPDARVWTVLIRNSPIEFTHSGMLGNCFFSEQANVGPVLQEVVQLLQNARL